ncbi:MAG TPA: D-alanine--D-alanine ligase [Oscillatoriaceae cyanobacterium]
MAKLRVAVLMGGPSTEREVSLRSGQMVLKNLDPGKYDAFGVEFSALLGQPEKLLELKAKADFVFIALHGGVGEDGTLQGLLDLVGLPYQGSGVLASALAMNKVRAKAVYRQLGIPTARSLDFRCVVPGRWQRGVSELFPPQRALYTIEEARDLIGERLGWDLVLKGASQGSTIGLALVSQPDELVPALEEMLKYDREILIEERLQGREFTAGVLGGVDPIALPLIEIRPKSGDLFDYEAKYTPGASEEICPAVLEPELTRQMQHLALQAHQGLGCWSYSRSDFILRDGIPYILETNTLPGMTETSLVPQAARAIGVMCPDLLDQLIALGLERGAIAAPATTPAS